jgi:preprotein translocase subunit SecD
MNRTVCLLATLLLLGSRPAAWSQEKAPARSPKLPDGIYAVQRDSLKEKDVRPLKEGETLVVDHHPYLKQDEKEPPRFLVVHSAPDVELDLGGEPRADKEGGEVARIFLQLQPKAATALERLTHAHLGRQVAIVLNGDVVTVHKIRMVIKGGQVQITSCVAGAAEHLFAQLKAHQKNK